MDRFIEQAELTSKKQVLFLKSNMDRFIGVAARLTKQFKKILKSNMDRFIAEKGGKKYPLGVF